MPLTPDEQERLDYITGAASVAGFDPEARDLIDAAKLKLEDLRTTPETVELLDAVGFLRDALVEKDRDLMEAQIALALGCLERLQVDLTEHCDSVQGELDELVYEFSEFLTSKGV